jgi:hypothetical protein
MILIIGQCSSSSLLRPCAQECFYGGAFVGPDRVAMNMGCDHDPIRNECFCRSDLQVNADSFLKSCVNSLCKSNTLDTNSALSIYDAYCKTAGFSRDAITATTAGTLDSPATATVTQTVIHTVFVKSGGRRLQSPFEAIVARLGGGGDVVGMRYWY